MITQKIALFIGAWDYRRFLVLFAEPSSLASEVDECTGGIRSLGDLGIDVPAPTAPSDGLWMFVGTRWSVAPDDGWTYSGEWRRPTDEEALAAACGENPCLEACGT